MVSGSLIVLQGVQSFILKWAEAVEPQAVPAVPLTFVDNRRVCFSF